MRRETFRKVLFIGVAVLSLAMSMVWAQQLRIEIERVREIGGLGGLPYADDWAHYYASTKRVIKGVQVYCKPFAPGLEIPQDAKAVIREPSNPPPLVLLLLPFTLLDQHDSWALWSLISLLSVASGTLLFTRFASYARSKSLMAFVAVLCSSPMLSNLLFGQFQAILFLLLIAYFIALIQGRHRAAGVLLGFACGLKFFALPLLVFSFAANHHRLVFYALLTFTGLVLGSSLLIPWGDYFNCGALVTQRWMDTTTSNVSLSAVLSDLVVDRSSMSPVGSAIKFSVFGLSVLTLYYLGLRARGDFQTPLQHRATGDLLAIVLLVWLAGLPLMWSHYYLLAWPSLLWFGSTGRGSWSAKSLLYLLLWFSLPLAPYFFLGDSQPTGFQWRIAMSYLTFLPGLSCWLGITLLVMESQPKLPMKILPRHSETSDDV